MDEAAALRAALRHDVLSAPIGFVLLGLGVTATAVALARRRNGGLPLLYLSISMLLYALRLLADTWTVGLLYSPPQPAWQKLVNCITYILPIPAFFFFERVIGTGWRSSIRRLWQLHVALALVAVPWEVAAREPGALLGPYRILVLVGITVTVANLFAPGLARTIQDLALLRLSFLVLGVFIVLENLRALGLTPWRDNAEPVGFLLFNCGLG